MDSTSGLFYHDVDISALEVQNAVISAFFDDDDNKEIAAADVQVRNAGDVLRVFMSTNTITVNYIIAAGGSGGSDGRAPAENRGCGNLHPLQHNMG